MTHRFNPTIPLGVDFPPFVEELCGPEDGGQPTHGASRALKLTFRLDHSVGPVKVGHVVTPTAESEIGAKGAGEAGTVGAPAAMNAINDALAPLNAQVTAMPLTPERILKALGKVWSTIAGLGEPTREIKV